MARPPTKQPPEEGAPEWMMTFGDLMSQLLTFFILLISFSMFDEVKYNTVKGALQYSFGIMKGWEQPLVPEVRMLPKRTSYPDEQRNFASVAYRIKNYAAQQGTHEDIETEVTGKGLIIRIKQQEQPLLFESGSATIKADAKPLLDQIIDMIAELPNPIEIHGHTDNIPIHTAQFPSNRDLSAARALSVLRYFETNGEIDPARMIHTGHGEFEPIDTNETPEGRARNRRVEILLTRLHKKPPLP